MNQDLTKEHIYFLRLCWLLGSITPGIVRKAFDAEFHPDTLHSTLIDKHIQIRNLKAISEPQRRLLNSKDVTSEKFDLTLMLCLLRHIADLNIVDTKPHQTDISVAADLSRLKFYRNVLSHLPDGIITEEDFEKYFLDIWQPLERIGKPYGFEMNADNCKTCKFDGISQKKADSDAFDLKRQDWMAKEETLVITSIMDLVVGKIIEKNAVVIKGHPGSGKSSTVQHAAIQLQNQEGFQIVPAYSINQIKKYHDPVLKQVFVLDDIFGKSCTKQSNVELWHSSLKDIEKLFKQNTKILIACNSKILESILKEKKIFTFDETEDLVVDLQSKEKNLIHYDQRKKIADIYLGQGSYDEEILSTNTEYFPLLCQMYATGKTGNMKLFFDMNICDHIKNDKTTSAVLCLFVILNNSVSEASANADILHKLSVQVDIRPRLTWEKAKTQLDNMSNSYVSKTTSQYKINNKRIFNLLLAYFGQDMFFSFVLNNSCSRTIRDKFKLQSSIKGVEECCIDVTLENELWYFKRLLRDITDGNSTDVFTNTQMSIANFRKKLISRIKNNPNASDVIHAILSCSHTKTSPLLMASENGFLDLVEFFIEIGMNINVLDSNNNTPLHLATANGFKHIVKILLNNKCDFNSCTNNTPLYIAIKNNHITIAEELLKKKADPNRRSSVEVDPRSFMQLSKDQSSLNIANIVRDERTPLYIASLKGRTECAELLLNYGADPNVCAYYNVSPLYAATEEGHIQVVDLLLENGANVNEEAVNKKTPLHVASEKGHEHIIKRLLSEGALIDATDANDTTPLLAAVKNRKKNAVRLLVQEKADPNKVDKYGNFPLRESVSESEICEILLDNNADPNFVNEKQEYALLMASEKNKVDTVMLLLQRNADINKKTLDQRSPLLVAVEENNVEVVKVLLRSGANPNDRNQTYQSVLTIASDNTNKEMVKMIKLAKKGILPQKTNESKIHFFVPDVNKKTKGRNISKPSYSSRKSDLPSKQGKHEVTKQNLKEHIHVKRNANEVTKTQQKKAHVISEIGHDKCGGHNIEVKGTQVNFKTKLSRKTVGLKTRKVHNLKEGVNTLIEVKRPTAKPHFRP